MNLKVVEHGSDVYYEAVRLREAILRAPLGLFFTQEEMAAEADHVQIVGLVDEKVLATAVLVPEAGGLKMQRVVVDSGLRGKGFGTEMMRFCEEYARENGFSSIYVHARDTAVDFYLKNNYVIEGDYFEEDTIPHLKMRKRVMG